MLFALVSLIAANLLPAVWALSGTLAPENLLFLYWLETWIIGAFTVFKIKKSTSPISDNENIIMKKQLFGKLYVRNNPSSVLNLFILQYTFLLILYGILLFGILIPLFFLKTGSYFDRVFVVLPKAGEGAGLFLMLMAFLVNHTISYARMFVGRSELENSSPVHQMLLPYHRIITLHFFVVSSALVLTMIQNNRISPSDVHFASFGTVLIKAFADLAFYINDNLIKKAPWHLSQDNTNPFSKRIIIYLFIFLAATGIFSIIRTSSLNFPGIVSPQIIVENRKNFLPYSDNDTVVPAVNLQTKATNILHVVFVPALYSDINEFKEDTLLFQQYLLSRQPFSEFAFLFRFSNLKTSLDFGCRDVTENDQAYVGDSLTRLGCDAQKIRQSLRDADLPYNRTIVLINDPNLRGLDAINGFMTVEWGGIPSDENIVLVNTSRGGSDRIFVHEFAHSFGLVDEYLLYQVPGPEKDFCPDNCCQSSACSLWKNIPGAECIQGCSYPNWYRSSQDSTMRQVLNENFSPVALDILRRRLRRHTHAELVAGSLGIRWNNPHPGTNPRARQGDMLSFYGETWNRGAATSAASRMSGKIDLNTDGSWDLDLPSASISGLSPDMVQGHRWSEVWQAEPGNHILEICVDTTNIVLEADDNNNCKFHEFTVEKNQISK